MNVLETPEIRRFLLRVFNDCHGEDPGKFFRASGLGIWSTFLYSLGLSPASYDTVRHRLLECGFLNVCFDGKTIDRNILMAAETEARKDNINCLMVSCLRHSHHPVLNEMGYTALPGLFSWFCKGRVQFQAHFPFHSGTKVG